jgi:hypothetical protein
MQNDDKERLQQPPIPTHLPKTVAPADVKKIVGDAVPHGADYNLPPPAGAGKSMGSGLDDSVGGPTMGSDPVPRGQAATARDQDSRAVDRHMGNLQQGNGGNLQSAGGSGHRQAGSQQAGNKQSGSRQSGNRQAANKQSDRQPSGGKQSGAPGNAQRDSGARSEGLLPGGSAADGRFEVSEEVSADQQSDQARRVGSMEDAAKGPHGDQLADAVARTLGKKDGTP